MILRELLSEEAWTLRLEQRKLEDAGQIDSADYHRIHHKLFVMQITFSKLCREWQ